MPRTKQLNPHRKPRAGPRFDAEGNVARKKVHFKPGTVALRDIIHYQKRTNFLLRKRPFGRLVREVAQDFELIDSKTGESKQIRFKASAMEAIQEATEEYMIETMGGANLMACFAKRKGIRAIDIARYRRVKYDDKNANIGI